MHMHNFGCYDRCHPCSPCSRLNDYNGRNDYGFCERYLGNSQCGWWCDHSQCAGQTFTIGGTVFGVDGAPAGGITIEYTVNGQGYTTATDTNGNYSISVRGGSFAMISVMPGFGVTATPTRHIVRRICSDMGGYDFSLGAMTPNAATISGNVSGLANNAGAQIGYTVNGTSYTTATGALGNYTFAAPIGSNVTITPSDRTGYSVTPSGYTINGTSGDTINQNFVYSGLLS